MSLDVLIHCRDGRKQRSLCNLTDADAPLHGARIKSAAEFQDIDSWDLTHSGLRICEKCRKLLEDPQEVI